MKKLLASPLNALLAGLAVVAVIAILWAASGGIDTIGLISLLLRAVHVVAAMVWIGMIWFVNFIQLAAIRQADDQARGPLMRLIVPNVAKTFLHGSTITVISGVLLLISTGYLFDRWVYSTVVYVSTAKALMLWGGVLGGVVMLGLAHGVIQPNLRIVLGDVPGDIEAVARAREKVALFARINLVLALPVTFVMLAASHFA
jgi:uncharacterized membrane protein